MAEDQVAEDGGLSRRNLLRGAAAAGVGAAVWASPSAAGLVGTPAYPLGCSTNTFVGVDEWFAINGSGVDPATGVSTSIPTAGGPVTVTVWSTVQVFAGLTVYTEYVDVQLPYTDCLFHNEFKITTPAGQTVFLITPAQWIDQGNGLYRYTLGATTILDGDPFCAGNPNAANPNPQSFFLPHCNDGSLLGGVWLDEITCCGPASL
ncbi:MAG: twin-arginine translocation signal domain-containing protein [Actinomycetia bacterium]|nr:twin-arginine translocation signal domain-containing protein [Actinomycetes bacterium]